MKKIILLVFLQTLWTAGFSQSLPFSAEPGISIQSTNLIVHWEAQKHPWPKTLWVYQMIPTEFSPTVISNLVTLGSFTEKDKMYSSTNGVTFSNSGRSLWVSFTEGQIEYWTTHNYSATDLAKDVPTTNQLFQLTTNFLPKLGISLSEIARGENGQPRITFAEPFKEYSLNRTFITNIEWRGVGFRRVMDGVEFLYAGGHCAIDFGEHGEVVKIELSWPSLGHDKLYSAATPKKIIQWIREGRADQNLLLDKDANKIPIDWSTVKSVTIKRAKAYYYGETFLGEREHQPIFPSWVHPYADLQA